MPKISLLLTSFNHAKYLREAIDSALNQTFSDFELIILDDCSSDNSWDIINEYTDTRIRPYRSKESGQVVFNINNAITNLAKADNIAIHHSDDVWELDKLEKQVAYLDSHPEIGAVFTHAQAIGEDSLPLKDENHFYAHVFNQPNRTRFEWLRFFFSNGNALCHPSVLIRKKCYEDCGLYRYDMAQLPDFDMWVRICLKYQIHVLSERLIKFRVRENESNTSGNRPEVRIRAVYEYYKLLQNYRKIPNIEDLIKIFPSSARFDREEKTDLDFALSMVALEEKPYEFTSLFGLETLYEIISNSIRAENIKQVYGFDNKSFIALTGQNDVFSRELVEGIILRDRLIKEREDIIKKHEEIFLEREILILKKEQELAHLNRLILVQDQTIAQRDIQISQQDLKISKLNNIIEKRNATINELYGSLSWRLTRPLRYIRNKIPFVK